MSELIESLNIRSSICSEVISGCCRDSSWNISKSVCGSRVVVHPARVTKMMMMIFFMSQIFSMRQDETSEDVSVNIDYL